MNMNSFQDIMKVSHSSTWLDRSDLLSIKVAIDSNFISEGILNKNLEKLFEKKVKSNVSTVSNWSLGIFSIIKIYIFKIDFSLVYN